MDSMQLKAKYTSTFFMAVAYALCIYALQFLCYKVGLFEFYPNTKTLAGWDAAWYQSIAQNGYVYWSWGNSNFGFFILFPALWALLHVGIWGVTVLNTLLFAAGFSILSAMLKAGRKQQLLFLTLPPLYFAFIPYTEALSFLLTVLCFYGVVSKKSVWVVISIFLLSLTRVSAAFLVPALLLMELLTNSQDRWWPAVKKSVLLYALPAAAGLASFIVYQYMVTGIWFLYFQQQSTFWGHVFSMPSFPLTNIAGSNTIVLSALATVFCVIAMLLLIIAGWRWLAGGMRQQDKLWVLSLGYMSAVLLLTLFFNPKKDGQTMVVGIYRYAMCTPFFFVFLQQFSSRIHFRRQHFISVFLLSNVVLLLFRSYFDLRSFLLFNVCTVVVLLYMLQDRHKWIALLLILAAMIAQALLFQDFLTSAHYPD